LTQITIKKIYKKTLEKVAFVAQVSSTFSPNFWATGRASCKTVKAGIHHKI